MNQKKYRGIIAPVVTPLTESYKLDKEAMDRIFGMFYEYSISPFILGTTGEFASLSWDLKRKFMKKAGKLKMQDTILYAGISSNCFEESVEFGRYCLEQGADVLVANLPCYYSLTDSQMKKYFLDLVETLRAPLIIYNIPSTTHMSIPISLVDELSYHPNIIGTKDSERNDERLQQSITLWKDRKDFSHFLGWAARSVQALYGGTDGLVPATANIVPEVYAEMLMAVEHNDRSVADKQQDLSDAAGKLYQEGRSQGESLWALKVLMEEKGLCQPYVMPPLAGQSEQEKQNLKQKYRNSEFVVK
jgi:dihydrodipicolinate synthase/N-acetylneuraminate lyase